MYALERFSVSEPFVVLAHIQQQKTEKTGVDDVVESKRFIELDEPEVDTTDWKIYRNKKYGFEFKYPSRLKLSTNEISESDITQIKFEDQNEVKIGAMLYLELFKKLKEESDNIEIFRKNDTEMPEVYLMGFSYGDLGETIIIISYLSQDYEAIVKSILLSLSESLMGNTFETD
jgi:hypothetical protein